jgi:hypothetical protein
MTEPKEKYFLKYNKSNIFGALLQAETHFKNLSESQHADAEGHANCIVKHLSEIIAEALEAQAHSLVVEGEENSRKFKVLKDDVWSLRDGLQSGKISAEEGIREVRRIRRYFESFNPEYDVSKCQACGNVEEILAKLRIPKTSIAELEEETAHRILTHLSSKYNVPKPKLKILDNCPTEPTEFGVFQARSGEPEIVLCRGSADSHKLLHEFAHYLQFLEKKPLSEQEAEQFALKEVEKPLYVEASHHNSSGEKFMPLAWREVGLIVGGQHIFKGIERGFEEVDRYMGKAAAPVAERPSTWLNIGGGLALILIPRFFKRIPETLDWLFTVGGGHMTTKAWDYIEEAMAVAPVAPAAGLYVPAGAPTSTSTQAGTSVKVGKYQ